MHTSPSLCVYVHVFLSRSAALSPRKAGNEQAEDCSNDVTQMSWVQIPWLKMRVEIGTLNLPSPPSLPPSLLPGTQSQNICMCVYYLGRGMCMLRVFKLMQIHVNMRDQT